MKLNQILLVAFIAAFGSSVSAEDKTSKVVPKPTKGIPPVKVVPLKPHHPLCIATASEKQEILNELCGVKKDIKKKWGKNRKAKAKKFNAPITDCINYINGTRVLDYAVHCSPQTGPKQTLLNMAKKELEKRKNK